MSGHSKWSQIKRQKGVADVRRGATFTKIANAITIATKEGSSGDPGSNFKLRLTMDQARAVNMPKENIQRAIDRGLGKGDAGSLDTVTYEGYVPGKVAIIIEAATDNKNRTTPEVKSILEKSGGTFASPGAVSWMFADCGMIVLPKNGKSFNDLFETAVDAGADDVEDADDVVNIYTKPAELEVVKKFLEEKGMVLESAQIAKKPTTFMKVTDEQIAKRAMDTIGKIEDLDDVQKVWSNLDIPEELSL